MLFEDVFFFSWRDICFHVWDVLLQLLFLDNSGEVTCTQIKLWVSWYSVATNICHFFMSLNDRYIPAATSTLKSSVSCLSAAWELHSRLDFAATNNKNLYMFQLQRISELISQISGFKGFQAHKRSVSWHLIICTKGHGSSLIKHSNWSGWKGPFITT